MKDLMTNVLGRLRLWQKLAVLGWIAGLMVAIPFYLFFANQQEIINFAEQERQGLEPALKMIGVLKATVQHRGLAASVLAGKENLEADLQKQKQQVDGAIAAFDSMAKELGYPGLSEKWGQFKQDWGQLAQGIEAHKLNQEQSWAAHTKLNAQVLDLVQAIADGSRMNLDPDPETYYLIQAVLNNSASLSEKLGQTRGYGAALLAKAEEARGQAKAYQASTQDRAIVYSLADRAKESLEALNQELGQFKIASPDIMKAHLEAPSQQLNELVEKTLPLARSEIVDANVLNASASDYYASFTKAIDATFNLIDAGGAVLKDLLEEKVDSAQQTQITTSVSILVVLLFAAFIAMFISQSIASPLTHLVGVVNKLASGDNTVRANMETYDEVGMLGRQFDIMVDQREAISEKIRKENEQLNNSVIELLQTVAKLAEKDLTVKVPVAEDITGLVADALNLLSQETANVMNQVVDIAGNVAQISHQVKSQADTVIGVASEEKHEVEQAAAELSQAAEVMQDIAQLALSCNEAAEQAIQTTDKAQETVLGTVEGITSIRDTIRETEKRIKRLGERSQEIGGVVSIINGIAERTHILAINASMHAASAGEAGRGFAVVANEVQKLAENAREATSKIAGLVNNIQLETADTVTTMNDAISQVVRGTSLAQEAGKGMRETRDTTANLVQLVRRIAESSRAQAQTSLQLRERALQIQKSTEHTYEQLQEQGAQTKRLVGFSEDLVGSVSVFKLPEAANA